MITIKEDEIISSYERIKSFIHKTPLISNNSINSILGCNVFFKMESLQKTGSFKIRGALNAVLNLTDEEKAKGIATHSSGNHAGALAYTGRLLGLKTEIVMPNNSSSVKIEAVSAYGAKITFCKPTLEDRENTLNSIIEKTGSIFIPPYNHLNIIRGAATCVYEAVNEINDFDYIISPIGGGGLASGSALSTKFFSNATFLAAEPTGASDAYQSLKEGKIIPSLQPTTICDGLRTSLGEYTFNILQHLKINILPVEDNETILATKLIAERMKYIVEPSSAITLAAIFCNKAMFRNKKVCLVISGGNLDLASFYK